MDTIMKVSRYHINNGDNLLAPVMRHMQYDLMIITLLVHLFVYYPPSYY